MRDVVSEHFAKGQTDTDIAGSPTPDHHKVIFIFGCHLGPSEEVQSKLSDTLTVKLANQVGGF